MNVNTNIIRVAIAVPLRSLFDYLLPANEQVPAPGSRICVPFGRKQRIGIVVEVATHTDVPKNKLRYLSSVVDQRPLLPGDVMNLLKWVSEYYLAPPGEVYELALPGMLRQNRAAMVKQPVSWQLTESGYAVEADSLKRAPLQQKLLLRLGQGACSQEELLQLGGSVRAALRRLHELGWIEQVYQKTSPDSQPQAGPQLTVEQRQAADVIAASCGHYACHVLHGVTGSGKTEVYLEVIADIINRGEQALVLVPEIGLTPQLLSRFRLRLGAGHVVVMHSGLAEGERLQAWLAAQQGDAGVVIGTRSAVFTPMPRLALIVVDEEHDNSFKQQEGVRYHARDVAIMRAYRRHIPIVLGSATPSMETMYKAEIGLYSKLNLGVRAADSDMPDVHLVDMRHTSMPDGLSPQLIQALRQNLEAGRQCIIYLNRRGYAPVYMCYGCGWIAQCSRCDARLVYHHRQLKLRCHHCGYEQRTPDNCPECQQQDLHPIGEGTEKLETALRQRLPAASIARLDRDTTGRRGALEDCLARMAAGEIDILVGTQMLAKGHDFPEVTLVCVTNADQGLYSVDYRGSEHLMQQVMQVAGRAGRRQHRGRVLVQTWHPEHAVFHFLKNHDYEGFARQELQLRRLSQFPPFEHVMLLRAEAPSMDTVMQFLHGVSGLIQGENSITVYRPVPAPMPRRAGRYRGQLLIQSADRGRLHQLMQAVLPAMENIPEVRKVRWSIDVDPVDLY